MCVFASIMHLCWRGLQKQEARHSMKLHTVAHTYSFEMQMCLTLKRLWGVSSVIICYHLGLSSGKIRAIWSDLDLGQQSANRRAN